MRFRGPKWTLWTAPYPVWSRAILLFGPPFWAMVGRSSRIFFKKGLGRRGKGPEKVHVLASHNRNSSALDLEASSLRDIAWVRLRSILFSQLLSSKLALWPELPSKLRVRDRQYEIFNLAALSQSQKSCRSARTFRTCLLDAHALD